MHCPLRRHRHYRGRPFHAARSGSNPSDRPGALRQGSGYAELVYSKERLTTPLRRTRPKGDANPGWIEISWDGALDAIAAAMRKLAATHGPQSVAFSQSSPSTTAIGDLRPSSVG